MSASADRTTIATGDYLRLLRRGRWEYVERIGASGVVAVLAVTGDRSLVLTEQFRPPVQARVIGLPAGLAGDGSSDRDEPLEEAARRELEEESGFTAASFRRLALLPSSPGLTAEQVVLYEAVGVTRIGEGGGDENEQIDVHVVPLAGIADWLEQQVQMGLLVDPKVYAALWWHDRT